MENINGGFPLPCLIARERALYHIRFFWLFLWSDSDERAMLKKCNSVKAPRDAVMIQPTSQLLTLGTVKV
jgi:hypothetical protein